MQVVSAGEPGNVLQQGQVRSVLIAVTGFANAQTVNPDALAGGKACSGTRRHDAAIVGAVGEQDQVLVAGRQVAQPLDAKADGIANGGIVPGNTGFDGVQPVTQAVVVEGQG